MWAEARKHEKKIRGIVIDLRRRAERRRAHYDAIKEDPVSFLRIHGNSFRVHVNANLSEAAESAMMEWNKNDDGESDQIDRFDVRAHLDQIPVEKKNDKNIDACFSKDELSEIMYERYREIVHNDFRGLDQPQVLNEIATEESYERLVKKDRDKKSRPIEQQKSAINFTYEDGEGIVKNDDHDFDNDDDEDSDDEGPGVALIEEVMNPALLSEQDKSMIDNKAMDFTIGPGVFIKLLKADRFYLEEKRSKMAEDLEAATNNEKGSRGRRRRRRERKIRHRIISELPSYAKKTEEKEDGEMDSSSSDDSDEDETEGQAQFITSFGGSSEDEAQMVKQMNKEKRKVQKKKRKEAERLLELERIEREKLRAEKRRYSRDSEERSRKKRSRHRSRSRDRRRSRSRSYDRRRRTSVSRTRRSRSREKRRRRSRSRRRSRDRRYSSEDRSHKRTKRSRSPRRKPSRETPEKRIPRRYSSKDTTSSSSSSASSASSLSSDEDGIKAVAVRAPGAEPGRKRVGPITPAAYKKPAAPAAGKAMSAAERIKMMMQSRIANAHEKEKVKRIIKNEEVEEAKKERQREWRQQLQKQKERGTIDVDIDRFTNEQMEKMIFDKSYNPLKKESVEDDDDVDEDDELRRKAELRARYATKA